MYDIQYAWPATLQGCGLKRDQLTCVLSDIVVEHRYGNIHAAIYL